MASHLIWLLLCSISSFICGVAASTLFHLKPRRTSPSSSSTATYPPNSAPPSSSSVDHLEIKYDVFLSFRGTDTRSGFLSHLQRELSLKNIEFFVDDQTLKQGDEISSTLLNAIKKSKISLVLFSEGYASSEWCLEELEQIIQCMESQKQLILPIFYKVDPSTVRHQKGSYSRAFGKHGKTYNKDRLQKWKATLKRAADLSGFDSSRYSTEADFIIEIVQYVVQRLYMTSQQSDLKGLVRIQKHIAHLEVLLCKKMQDVRIIGIWGMGGIGKTTIAEALFNKLYDEYEGSCFVNVEEQLEKHGRTQLKKQLLSVLLGEDPNIVMHNGIHLGCLRKLQCKKVLVVLDNINKSMQVELLIGGCKWFGSNSRIIVTSRNKNVFPKECEIYEVKQLSFEESLELLNLNIALPEVCIDPEQDKLSKMVVKYCKGNPLAIKVLGCSLCHKEKNDWESKLKKLDKFLDQDIQNVLQSSYDELDDEQKNIFLYLACFFKYNYESKQKIISLLDGDYYTIDALEVLQNRALIIISNDGIVSMHDLIRKIEHEIAQNKCLKNPGQHNHLWGANDIYKVLENNKGTEEIESINLKMMELQKDLHITPQSFARMDNLKLLQFELLFPSDTNFTVYTPEEDFILPAELRLFCWDYYPSRSINPLRSCLDNLVELQMRNSCLQKLWDGT